MLVALERADRAMDSLMGLLEAMRTEDRVERWDSGKGPGGALRELGDAADLIESIMADLNMIEPCEYCSGPTKPQGNGKPPRCVVCGATQGPHIVTPA